MSEGDLSQESLLTDPREKAGLLSILCFTYTWDVFRRGLRCEVSEKDLYRTLSGHRSKVLGDRLEREWNEELRRPEPSLYNAIRKVFSLQFSKYILLLLLIQITRISQPISLYYLLKYFVPGQKEYTKGYAYMWIAVISLAGMIFVCTAHLYLLGLQHLGMQIRVACSSLVYRKCLRFSKSELDHLTIGQLVNLLSNDVSRFDNVTLHLPYMFVGVVEIPSVVALMLLYAGLSPLSGLGVTIITLPLIIFAADRFSKIRKHHAHKSDVRARLMDETISGIQVIKMCVWERAFEKLITKARRFEMKDVLKAGRIRAIFMSFYLYLSRLSIFATILTQISIGNTPTPGYTFFVVALFNTLRQSLTIMFPSMVTTLAEATVSTRRLQDFLLFSEYQRMPRFTLEKIGVTLIGGSATWREDQEDTLKSIDLTLGSGELLVVIGAVGSGKSSLIYAILEELPLYEGTLERNGKISYASQEPWLFNASIKENIIYDQAYNTERYKRIVEICALRRDFSLLPFGDETLIGEKGITLSGGQKARVSLARAVYQNADIYLLDDPLSAVDSEVGKIIFEECVRKFLSDKCTILITHQIQYLKEVPRIALMRSGAVVFQGNYEELRSVYNEFTSLLEKGSTQQPEVIAKVEKEEAGLEPVPQTFAKELRDKGTIACKVYTAYLKRGGNCATVSNLFGLLVVSQCLASASDVFITYWVNKEQDRSLGAEVLPLKYYVASYALLIMFLFAIALLRSFEFMRFCAKASRRLHDDMFNSVVRAPMGFFYRNPSGRVLNRFTKDIGTLDDVFPIVALETLQVLAIFVVTLYVNVLSVLGLFMLMAVFCTLRTIYLRTSRGVKRMEGVSKSPVFTHISSSLYGLTTIRAFRTEEFETRRFDRLQDVHTSVWNLFLTTSRSFSFALDLTCWAYNTFVFFSLMYFYDVTYGGTMGLLITQSLMLTGMLQWGMRQWSELENNMTSVERIYEYIQLRPESDTTTDEKSVPTDWPKDGSIEYKKVSVRYKSSEPPVLNSLSFRIEPREKIGIVGRTGAGKSTLIASLFRLVDTTGFIVIDGINTRNVALDTLRSRLAIIPQEPVLFAGTLRRNLDPFRDYSDHAIWQALREVEMKGAVNEMSDQLYHRISERGANFSVGQRQLLCLARAILRDNSVLVMDEATANVDPKTDQLIQETIRRRFKDCTVLTVAHRLNTILDSDRILVLEDGNLVEVGHPRTLLQNEQGHFYRMVQNTGPAMAANLIKQVEENYRNIEQKSPNEAESKMESKQDSEPDDPTTSATPTNTSMNESKVESVQDSESELPEPDDRTTGASER